MQRIAMFIPLLLSLHATIGCSQSSAGHGAYAREAAAVASQRAEPAGARLLVHTATATVEVWEVETAEQELSKRIEAAGGFIESSSQSEEQSAQLAVRIPAPVLESFLEALDTLGTVTARSMNTSDVTESYADNAAKIENKRALRDKLRQLLTAAKSVTDIIAIQKELNDVQTELDTLEGRQKRLDGQISLASVSIGLERKTVLGPLGLALGGLGWVIEKLFYLRN